MPQTQQTPPDTLPANFFDTQTSTTPPDTLPANFFDKQDTQSTPPVRRLPVPLLANPPASFTINPEAAKLGPRTPAPPRQDFSVPFNINPQAATAGPRTPPTVPGFDFNKALAAQGTGTQPGTLQDALAHQGFLDSAWEAIKSMPNLFGSLSLQHTQDLNQDLDQVFNAKTPDDRRQAISTLLLKNVPFASTLYKMYQGNLPGAAGDIAPMVAAERIAKLPAAQNLVKSVPGVSVDLPANVPERIANIGVSPEKSAAAQQVMNLGQKYDVPLTAGDISQAPGLKNMEVSLEKVPLQGMQKLREEQQVRAKAAATGIKSQYEEKLLDTDQSSLEELEQAASAGDERARNVLGKMQEAGNDPDRIIQASIGLGDWTTRQTANNLYDNVQKLAEQHNLGDVPMDATGKAIGSSLQELLPAKLQNKEVIRLIQDVKESISPKTRAAEPPVPSALVDPNERPIMGEAPAPVVTKPDNSYGLIRQLHSDLGDRIRDYYQGNNALIGEKGVGYLERVQNAIEDDIRNYAENSGVPEIIDAGRKADNYYRTARVPYKNGMLASAAVSNEPDQIFQQFIKAGKGDRAQNFYDALDDKGRAAVRYNMVAKAVDDAVNPQSGIFSPQKFFTSVDKLQDAYGVFFKAKDNAEIQGFQNLMGHVTRAGQFAENPPTGQRVIPYLIAGAAAPAAKLGLAHPVGAVGVAALFGAMRALFTTTKGQNLLLRMQGIKPGTPLMNSVWQEVGREMPKLAAQPPEEPPPPAPPPGGGPPANPPAAPAGSEGSAPGGIKGALRNLWENEEGSLKIGGPNQPDEPTRSPSRYVAGPKTLGPEAWIGQKFDYGPSRGKVLGISDSGDKARIGWDSGAISWMDLSTVKKALSTDTTRADLIEAPETPTTGQKIKDLAKRFLTEEEGSLTLRNLRKADRAAGSEQSTRVPTAVKSTEDPLSNILTTGYDSWKRDPEMLRKNVNAMLDYPNFRDLRPQVKSGTLSIPDAAERIVSRIQDNLQWLHDSMPENFRDRARLWYDGAHKIARKWAGDYGATPEQVAGSMAVTSPGTDWFVNAERARRLLEFWQDRNSKTWDPRMATTWRDKVSKAVPEQSRDQIYKLIKGKSFNQVANDPDIAPIWFRLYDEAVNPREYRTLTPEGKAGDLARIGSGDPRQFSWSDFGQIEKVLSILEDGSKENIHQNLGKEHKVRNFYNNIINPDSPREHTTIDTHAVAAGLMRPLSQMSTEVGHNFGGAGSSSSSISGESGTYALHKEAYRRAAAANGLLPREMQSITWEAIRSMFSPQFKRNPANVEYINSLWQDVSNGKITADAARQRALQYGGGFDRPAWFKGRWNPAIPKAAKPSSKSR